MASHAAGTDSPRTISLIKRFCENIGIHIIQVSGLIGLAMNRMDGIMGIMITSPM